MKMELNIIKKMITKKYIKKYGIHIGRKIYNDKIIKDIKMKKNSRINDINLIIEKKIKI